MIVVSGYDDHKNYYMNSWCFDYHKPVVSKTQIPIKRNPVNLGEADNHCTMDLHVGNVFKVTLPANPSTGYQWEMMAGNGASIVSQVGTPEFKPTNNSMGSGGMMTFTFKVVDLGQGKLQLIYHRPWEKNAPPFKIYEINLIVKDDH